MANTRIAIRRTSTAGKVPTTSDINTGELGLNMTDQVLYSSNGTVIFVVAANTIIQQAVSHYLNGGL